MTQVLVLANSRKLSGRCVAGIDLATGQWVRPVNAMPGGELTLRQTHVAGTPSHEVAPGDVVEMPLGRARSSVYHPEDVQIAGPWSLIEQWSAAKVLSEMEAIVTGRAPLLGSAEDRLSVSAIKQRSDHASLQLVRSDLSDFFWTTSMRGNPQLRGTVNVGTSSVDLSVTDPQFEKQFSGHAPWRMSNCLLTVSLGEPFSPRGSQEEFCFKIIAAVMPL